jgi:hypothetical protein
MRKIIGALMLMVAFAGAVPRVSAVYVHEGRVEVSGTVKIDGALAPVGTVIQVAVNGIEKDANVKKAGEYRVYFNAGEAEAGDEMAFKVDGVDAGTFALADSGRSYDIAIAGQVKGDTDENVRDGDLIQCRNASDPFAVYIVKIAGGKKYIRHIVSLEIFGHYEHFVWGNIIQVKSLAGYTLSSWVRVNTGPSGQAMPNDKVWEINGDQTKHWIDMTAEEFLLHGGSEEAIYSINQGELNLYKEGPAVKLM